MRRTLYLTLAFLALAGSAAAQSRVVYRIAVTGTVENGLAPYIARSLREAEAAAELAGTVTLGIHCLTSDAPGRLGQSAYTMARESSKAATHQCHN